MALITSYSTNFNSLGDGDFVAKRNAADLFRRGTKHAWDQMKAVNGAGDVGLFSMHRGPGATNKGTYGCAVMPKVWRLTKGQDSAAL